MPTTQAQGELLMPWQDMSPGCMLAETLQICPLSLGLADLACKWPASWSLAPHQLAAQPVNELTVALQLLLAQVCYTRVWRVLALLLWPAAGAGWRVHPDPVLHWVRFALQPLPMLDCCALCVEELMGGCPGKARPLWSLTRCAGCSLELKECRPLPAGAALPPTPTCLSCILQMDN